VQSLMAANIEQIGILSIQVIRIIGNLIAKNDSLADDLIDLGVCDYLEKAYICCDKTSLRRDILGIISNLFAGNKKQLEFILKKSNLLKLAFAVVDDDIEDTDVRYEASFSLVNMCMGSDIELSLELLDLKMLEKLVKLLYEKRDKRLIMLALEALERLFSHGENMKKMRGNNPFLKQFKDDNNIAKLESLVISTKENKAISKKATEILDTFFKNDMEVNTSHN